MPTLTLGTVKKKTTKHNLDTVKSKATEMTDIASTSVLEKYRKNPVATGNVFIILA